jgi:hypothetical protein
LAARIAAIHPPPQAKVHSQKSGGGMSVHIDELNPETRARVLKQIEGTEGVTTALAVIEPKNRPSFPEAEYDIQSIKTEIAAAWKNCIQTEKYGLEFGRVCYEAQQKFRTVGGVGNKGKGIAAIWRELNIPERTAYRWIDSWMESKGLVRLHIEKRNNRSEPPDSFEVLRSMALNALQDGFKSVQGDSSHVDAAKTWARLRLLDKLNDAGEPIPYFAQPMPAQAPKPKPEKPIAEYKSLIDAVPAVRSGGVEIPPSRYGVAEIEESVAAFTVRLVSQLKSASDKKIAYASLIRKFQDLLGEL